MSYVTYLTLCLIPFWHFYTGIKARLAETQVPAASDFESNWSMDPDDACDNNADQFPDLDGPDSPGRIKNCTLNIDVLAAVWKRIPECIDKACF